MQKKIMSATIGTLMFAIAGQTFAQQASAPAATTQPANPAQQVVIRNDNQGVPNVPLQNANPYGSVQNQGTGTINYGGANTINDNRQIPVSSQLTGAARDGSGIPNPSQAQRQMGVPSQLPSGLPQDSNIRQGNIDPVEATINILNTPDAKIRQLNRDLYNKGKVINETPVTPPRSVNGVLTASLAPGATPPVIRLSQNRTTAIIVTDITGQPWPIINYDGLSDDDFTVKRLDNPSPDGYVLSITPKGAFVTGNLEVILKGLPSPLSIDFVSAQKEVDAKTEIRVQAKGPNTQYTSIGVPDGIDTSLLSLLQGVAPQGAKELRVSSPAVQAWLAKDGKMYVRTRYKVMSPAFENVTSSPDGTYAYKMVPVPVVLYKAAEGRFGEFNVDGF